MAQPGDFAYQVKTATDIVRVVGEYVRLKKSGGSRYMGLCPFHQEKTPSFSVNGALQFYHCFGCGASGDVFKFVMEQEKFTFPEALKTLAERAGIPIPRQRGPEADAEARLRAALLEMHEEAAACYQRLLGLPDSGSPEGAHARRYLERRGITPELAAEFRLGYAPGSGSGLLKVLERSFSAEQMEAGGLILKRDSGGHFDRFRNRLMFPICNESGKVIAFGGRALSDEDQPKYLNSSETPIYRKSRVLFNYHRAREVMRREGRVVLVEGYMDAIGVYSTGVKNVVASCGTSLTLLHVKALSPLVKTIVVNYDPDSAGAAATERSVGTLLEEDLEARVLVLPAGLDPDEFVRERGAEAYRAQLAQAPLFFHFLVDRARAAFDLGTAAGRTDAARYLLQYIHKLPDRVERAEMAKELADRLGLDRHLVTRELAAAAAERRGFTGSPTTAATQYEKELLRAILEVPEAGVRLLGALSEGELWGTWLSKPILDTLLKMNAPLGHPIDIAALMDRLEAPQRALLAGIVNQDSVDLITPEKGQEYVAELARLKKLRQLREERRRELAATSAPASPEQALAQAKIAFEIKEIDAQLNAPHGVLPRQSPAGN